MTRPLQVQDLEAITRESHRQGSAAWDKMIGLMNEFHALSNSGEFADAESAREEALMHMEAAFDGFTRGYHAMDQARGRA